MAMNRRLREFYDKLEAIIEQLTPEQRTEIQVCFHAGVDLPPDLAKLLPEPPFKILQLTLPDTHKGYEVHVREDKYLEGHYIDACVFDTRSQTAEIPIIWVDEFYGPAGKLLVMLLQMVDIYDEGMYQ
jgi:hypothetical protein